MKRVLIINDSRFERLFLKDMIMTLGFEVNTTDEYGFLRQVEALSPEMVIVNYTMPGLTGDEVIKRIKSRYPRVKCLLSSCSNLNPASYPLVDGILHTPVDREKLSQMLSIIQDAGSEVAVTATSERAPNEISQRPVPPIQSYRFCPFCGERIQQSEVGMSFCPFCGHKMP